MAATFSISVFTGVTQTVYFGASTAAGAGARDIGAAGLTIIGGANNAHWQVADSGGRTLLSPSAAGVSAGLSGPYTLILSNSSHVVINIVANATSIASSATLKTALQGSLAYGHTLLLRDSSLGGSYPIGSALEGITIGTRTGSFTAPTDKDTSTNEAYSKGLDLDTGTYVRVKPHTGESVTLSGRFQITSGGYVRISDLTFSVLDGIGVDATGAGMLQITSAPHIAVDNCIFQASPSDSGYADVDRRRGIYTTNACTNMVVQDCSIYDCWDGISSAGAAYCCVVGVTIRRSWNDAAKATPGDNMRWCWNLFYDKKQPDSGAHPDFLQLLGTGVATDITQPWFIGNIFARGEGRATKNDGQGIFADDLGTSSGSTNKYLGAVVAGNRYLGGYSNVVYFGGYSGRTNEISNGGYICYNTLLSDTTVASNPAGIVTAGGSCTASGMTVDYNLTTSTLATGGNIAINRATDYPTYIAGGNGILDSGVGTDLASIVASLNIKTGSAADTASPKVGAHQAYFDYANRTITGVSLPTHP